MKLKENIAVIQPYIPGVLREGAIKLASNENPLGPSPKAVKALKSAQKTVSLYPDGGCVKLKNKLAQKYNLPSEYFIVGNGSDEIFLFIAGAYIDKGDQMVTSQITFSEYAFATKVFGGEPVFAEISADGKYQLNKIREKVTDKTKVIFLANPNNPTGTYFDQESFASFMAGLPATVLVVLDEAYSEFVQAKDYPDTVPMLSKYKNLLITRTFSKIYGLAGLRVGYAIGHPDVINGLNKTREPFNVNLLAQEAAVAALDDQDFVRKSIKSNEKGKRYLYKELKKLGLDFYKTEANFIYILIPLDCMDVFQQLMDQGVTIRPMKSFGVNNAIRVTVGTMSQNKYFIEKFKELLKK